MHKKQLLSSGPSFCGAVCLESNFKFPSPKGQRRGEIVVLFAGFFWISKRNQIWEFEIRLGFFWKKSLSPLLNNFKYISVGLFLSSLGLGISPYLHRSLHRPQLTELAPFFGDNASLASVGLLRPLITAEWPTIARKHHAFGMPNGS